MKLTSLSVSNFRDLTFTETFADASIFVGENWTGKTSRIDAIRLLLAGYLPETGKTAKSTFELNATGRTMEIRATFDTGETGWRKWWVEGDTVKTAAVMPLKLEAFTGFSVMCSASEYLEKGRRERIESVLENMPSAAEWTAGTIADRVREQLAEFHPPRTDLCLEGDAIDTFRLGLLSKFSAQGRLLASKSLPAMTPQDLIAFAIEYADEEKKKSADFSEQMQETIRGLSYLRTQDQAAGPSISTIELQQAQLKGEILALTERKGGLDAKYKAIKEGQLRAGEIKRSLANLQPARVAIDDLEAAIKSTRAVVDSLPNLKTQIGEMQKGESHASKLIIQGTEGLRYISANRHTLEKRLSEVDGATHCPFCGNHSEDWKKRRMAELVIQIANLEKDQNECEGNLRDMRAAFALAEKIREDLQRGQDRRDALLGEILKKGQELETARGNITKLEGLEAELAAIAPDDPSLKTEIGQLTQSLQVKKETLGSLDTVHRQAMARAGDLQRLAAAEQQRDKSNLAIPVAKQAAVILRQMQIDIVEEAFKPILETANDLFGHLMRSPLTYHDGMIGTRRNGRFYSHRTFSGTEKALSYCAIQIALAAASPFKLAMIDELGRLSNDNARSVIKIVVDAIRERKINQFIGIAAENLEGLNLLAGNASLEIPNVTIDGVSISMLRVS